MQRTAIILACFFICVNCFSQQYPFVHYSPKDGLISNSIRNIYQDSGGRLYFTSINGLSVYDGTRFQSYSARNGFANDMGMKINYFLLIRFSHLFNDSLKELRIQI